MISKAFSNLNNSMFLRFSASSLLYWSHITDVHRELSLILFCSSSCNSKHQRWFPYFCNWEMELKHQPHFLVEGHCTAFQHHGFSHLPLKLLEWAIDRDLIMNVMKYWSDPMWQFLYFVFCLANDPYHTLGKSIVENIVCSIQGQPQQGEESKHGII